MESRTSLPPPAAQALFRAARDHATGWLTLSAGGAEARLYLQGGDVVGARLGFGYQTLAQALLAAGLLDPPTFDALWARGETAAGSEALLQATGADAIRAGELQMLASVQRLVRHGGEASFMPALVDVTSPRVAGARAVRAAFQMLGPLPADAIVGCRDVEACAGWLLRDEDRELLARFTAFRTLGQVSSDEAALLRLLQHDGRVEILDAAGWEARAAAERAAESQRAAEEARRDVARAAIESARQAEEGRRTEQRQRAEQARRALEAARAAEAAWREAQSEVTRRMTAVEEEALADTLVRGRTEDAESTDTARIHVEITDPAFPDPGFGPRDAAEQSAEVTRRTGPLTGTLEEPDTLRPVISPLPPSRRDTLKNFPVAGEGEPPVPQRSKTEEPVIVAAPDDPALAPGQPTVRKRDTLRPFASPVVNESPTLPAEPALPSRSTPVWGSDVDELAAADTLLRTAERVEVVPMPSPSEMEPILLGPEAEVPAPGSSPADLVAEMTEALRRAGADTSVESWLTATEGTVSTAPAAPAPHPPMVTPGQFKPGSLTPRPALRLGPAGSGTEEDLWRLVQPAPAEPAAPASFEEALASVDAHLSSLVGLQPAGGPGESPPGPDDAVLQASADAGVWQMDTLPETPELPGEPPSALEATPAVTPSGEYPGEPSNAARERRQRLLRRAIQNLGSLASRGPRIAGSATPLEPTPAPVPPPPPRTPAEQGLARQIEQRFAGLAGERNRFDVLGLHLEATAEHVKRAYLDLVKVFHPDRLPPSLIDLVPQSTAIFDSLREAHEYLLDDARRAAHAEETTGLLSGRPLRDQAEAAEAFRAGEAALRRRDYLAAEAQFEASHRLYPRAQVLAARAWAIYMDPDRKAEAGAARAMMVDALKEDPTCDRAHYQLGVIARVEGDVDRAERHFREALRSNPRHLEASQELRLIEMRKRGAPARKPR